MLRSFYLIIFLSFSLLAHAPEGGKPVVVKTSIKPTPAWSGETMFKAYCASCHGTDAKGNGPAAQAMKSAVPDLTAISKRYGGKFPELKVVTAIKGDPNIIAHGSKDMPVWGTLLCSGATTDGEDSLRARNLTRYIQNLQRK